MMRLMGVGLAVGMVGGVVVSALAGERMPFGFCSHLSYDEFEERGRALEMMRQTGADEVRTDFNFQAMPVGSDGLPVLDKHEMIVRDAAAHGLEIYAVLHQLPKGKDVCADLDLWRACVRKTVRTFKGRVRHWEIWNEPNLPHQGSVANPTNYVPVLKAASEVIRAEDPAATVLLAGMAGVPAAYLTGLYELGVRDLFDVMNVHLYSQPEPPEERFGKELATLRKIMKRFGDGEKPVWVTEFGWPTHKPGVSEPYVMMAGLRMLRPDRAWRIVCVDVQKDKADAVAQSLRDVLPKGWTAFSCAKEDLADVLARGEADAVAYPPGETYPVETVDAVADFVTGGGALVEFGGYPLWYAFEKGVPAKVDTEAHRRRLRIGADVSWRNPNLLDWNPTFPTKAALAAGYKGDPAGLRTGVYFDARYLKPGDEMLPITEGKARDGSTVFGSCVYRFGSDMKGGVVLCGRLSAGGRANRESEQAEYLVRALDFLGTNGVAKAFVYEFRSPEKDLHYSEDNFGCVHRDFRTKPAYEALCRRNADVCRPADIAEVKIGGKPGALVDSSLNIRAFSPQARTTVYEETVNAFATHWDDADGRSGWQNEYWGKTMLSYAGTVAYTRDPELTRWVLDSAHAFVKKYQQPNGYLSTYREDNIGVRTKEDNPHKIWNFNTWGRKYTLWALVELSRVTGDAACLDAAEKLADHLCAQLKRLNVEIEWTGSWAGLSSMTILKPLLLLNEARPKAAYRELADHIISAADREGPDAIDMNLIRLALSDKPVSTWFGDRAMYLAKAYELLSFFEGVAEYYRVTGDPRILKAVRAFHRHLVDEELNALGSAGFFDHFLYARKRVNAMTELCDVTHWIRLNRELYLLTGETAYLDLIEEAFYNAFLAGVSPDGAWGAHIVRGHGTRHLAAPPQTGMRYHQCCPDNMLRTYFDWAASVADVAANGAVDLNLFSDAWLSVGGAAVEIAGGYPVSDDFRIKVAAEKPTVFRLRVPAWSKTVSVDGKALTPTNGRIELTAAKGVTGWRVAFDLSPRIVDSTAPEEEDISVIPGQREYFSPDPYTVKFMEWMTPEMCGKARRFASATVKRGPLVLAKGCLAGTSKAETFDFKTVNALGWKAASLTPAVRTATNVAAWGVWTLELTRGDERKFVPVADFWSVSAPDDPENWFSVWF